MKFISNSLQNIKFDQLQLQTIPNWKNHKTARIKDEPFLFYSYIWALLRFSSGMVYNVFIVNKNCIC